MNIEILNGNQKDDGEEVVKMHIKSELWKRSHLREFPVGFGKDETVLGTPEQTDPAWCVRLGSHESAHVQLALQVHETKIRRQRHCGLHGHRLFHIRNSYRGLFGGHPKGHSHDVRHVGVPRGPSGRVAEDEQEGSGTDEGRSVRENDNQGRVSGSKAIRVRDRRVRRRVEESFVTLPWEGRMCGKWWKEV